MAATDGRGESERVAVLGTGIMGSAMARNLVWLGVAGRRRAGELQEGGAAASWPASVKGTDAAREADAA